MSHERMDSIFQQIQDNVTGAISSFAAFLFWLFAAGALYGIFFQNNIFLLTLPVLLGALALYSRNITTVVLILVLLIVMGVF